METAGASRMHRDGNDDARTVRTNGCPEQARKNFASPGDDARLAVAKVTTRPSGHTPLG